MSEEKDQLLAMAEASIKSTTEKYIMFRLRCDVPMDDVEEELKSIVRCAVIDVDEHLANAASQIAKSFEEEGIL